MIENSLGLTVTTRFVGPKYIELLSFPNNFSEEEALAAIAVLQGLSSVEQIAVASAANLVFRSGDFGNAYGPGESIPESIRRGLDTGPVAPVDPAIVEASAESADRGLEAGVSLERGGNRLPRPDRDVQ
ncbi:MAG: hypothetical protein H0U99_09205 [Chthoniobacterales bacterium]|nr:hypothetical protein [Chthoniobacterales bacterium]